MDIATLRRRLADAVIADDPDQELANVVALLEEQGADVSFVAPILEFMEGHPDVELGSPGPLVHFVERFYRSGYEAELLASLRRRPVPHTIWMLHRLINGTKERVQLDVYWEQLEAAAQHPDADEATRRECRSFLVSRKPKRSK